MNRLQVRPNRVVADSKPRSERFIVESGNDQSGDFEFARRQAVAFYGFGEASHLGIEREDELILFSRIANHDDVEELSAELFAVKDSNGSVGNISTQAADSTNRVDATAEIPTALILIDQPFVKVEHAHTESRVGEWALIDVRCSAFHPCPLPGSTCMSSKKQGTYLTRLRHFAQAA